MSRVQETEQRIQNVAMGNASYRKYITSADAIDATNTFLVLQVMEDATFSSIYDAGVDQSTFFSGLEVLAGSTIYGEFTNVNLSAGKVIGHSLKSIQ